MKLTRGLNELPERREGSWGIRARISALGPVIGPSVSEEKSVRISSSEFGNDSFTLEWQNSEKYINTVIFYITMKLLFDPRKESERYDKLLRRTILLRSVSFIALSYIMTFQLGMRYENWRRTNGELASLSAAHPGYENDVLSRRLENMRFSLAQEITSEEDARLRIGVAKQYLDHKLE